MSKDPTHRSENDTAPFRRTSEAAAASRQHPPTIGHKPGEPIHPPVMPEDDNGAAIAAVSNVSRGNLLTPTRPRRPDERNPELDPKPADREKR